MPTLRISVSRNTAASVSSLFSRDQESHRLHLFVARRSSIRCDSWAVQPNGGVYAKTPALADQIEGQCQLLLSLWLSHTLHRMRPAFWKPGSIGGHADTVPPRSTENNWEARQGRGCPLVPDGQTFPAANGDSERESGATNRRLPLPVNPKGPLHPGGADRSVCVPKRSL